MNLYRELALELARGIEAGVYRPGDKLPGIRSTSSNMGVSPATAVAAYQQLELDGYIEARPRSGFYVKPRQRPNIDEPAQTIKAPTKPKLVTGRERVLRLAEQANHPDVVKFGAAVPDPYYLPTRAVEKALTTSARQNRARICNYEFPLGAEKLRRQLARRMTEIGCLSKADDIVITSGCQEAVHLALKILTQPGDVIALESPTYHGHLQTADSLGLKVVEIPTHPRTGISLEALELALEQWPVKACLVIPNFSNPLGALMPDKNKKALVKLMARFEVPLIEDDIYGDLGFNQKRPGVLKTYDRTGNVLHCSSFSKTMAPGLRIGWIMAGHYHEQIAYQKFITSISAPTLQQLAVASMLESGQYQKHLRFIRTELAQCVSNVVEAIGRYFPAGTRVSNPEGGCVLWVELPKQIDTVALAEKAIEKGVSIAPGPIFSISQKYRNCMRLSCGVVWNRRTERAIETLAELMGIPDR